LLAAIEVVLTASAESNYLEDVFGILRFRRRGVVSFRKFVILNVWRRQDAKVLRDDEGPTQPVRVLYR
jgi:hypothetical protein